MIKLPKGENGPFAKMRDVGEWGKEEFAIVQPHIKNFDTCLDIGAHVGITSLRYARYFKTVHSFEPIHYSLLRENTSHLDNVIIHDVAVSDSEKVVKMYSSIQNSGVGVIPHKYNKEWINKYFNKNKPHNIQIDVHCKTIDGLKLNNIDFVKIDVEGYNIPVINGMLHTLKRCKPVIQIEMAFGATVNNIVNRTLNELGYTKFNSFDRDNFYK